MVRIVSFETTKKRSPSGTISPVDPRALKEVLRLRLKLFFAPFIQNARVGGRGKRQSEMQIPNDRFLPHHVPFVAAVPRGASKVFLIIMW